MGNKYDFENKNQKRRGKERGMRRAMNRIWKEGEEKGGGAQKIKLSMA